MPTIEIASIDAPYLSLDQNDFQVAIEVDNTLISHRGLFSKYLKVRKGVIIHIGNSEFRVDRTGGFFAGGLLEWNFEYKIEAIKASKDQHMQEAQLVDRFQIFDCYKFDIQKILETAIKYSPVGKAVFLSDIQFGPTPGLISSNYTFDNFWSKHEQIGLAFNTLYEISG